MGGAAALCDDLDEATARRGVARLTREPTRFYTDPVAEMLLLDVPNQAPARPYSFAFRAGRSDRPAPRQRGVEAALTEPVGLKHSFARSTMRLLCDWDG